MRFKVISGVRDVIADVSVLRLWVNRQVLCRTCAASLACLDMRAISTSCGCWVFIERGFKTDLGRFTCHFLEAQ